MIVAVEKLPENSNSAGAVRPTTRITSVEAADRDSSPVITSVKRQRRIVMSLAVATLITVISMSVAEATYQSQPPS